MKIGRALADAALTVPGIAPLIPRLQTRLRSARSRRRARRIAARVAAEAGGGDPAVGTGSEDEQPVAGPAATPAEYAVWIAHQERPQEMVHLAAAPPPSPERAPPHPLVSLLVPVYRVKTAFLVRTLDSLRAQSFTDWEACFACADPDDAENRHLLERAAAADPRFRVEFLPHNGGISANSNAALAMARGTFVGLLDHDDELAPFALARMAEAIAAHPEADFLYSDKDSIDEDSTLRQHALFKPQWSPEILWSVNYLTHFNLLRRGVVVEVGGFRSETDGAQDWDIFLRVCARARGIVRVPGVHYHWRIHAASTSTGIAAKPYALDGQLRALEDHVVRQRLPARVEPSADSGFQLKWRLPADLGIQIVINGTGVDAAHLAALAATVAGDPAAGGRPRRVTVIADPAVAAAFAPSAVVEVIPGTASEIPRLANDLVARALGDTQVVVFLSGHVAELSPGWLAELAGWVGCHPEIGFASGLVLDPGGSVVEAGLVVDRFGTGSPMFRGSPLRQWGWFGGPLWYRNCSAATPWAVAVQADAWVAAGGFDTRLDWQGAFVDLCRGIRREGRRGMVDPHARVTLHPVELPAVPPFHDSLRDDPHFHPAFSAVAPLTLDATRLPTASAVKAAPAAQPRWSLPRVPRLRLPRRAPAPPAAVRPVVGSYASDALALARINGSTRADLAAPQQHPERVGRGPGAGWCNWFLPPFDNPYYGGVMTILRCADYLTRAQGLRQRFLICGPCDGPAIHARIAVAFPGLASARLTALDCAEAIIAIPAADYSFATLWTTAYVLQKVRNTGLKFYFLQDWEPLFYPAGSTSAQAELTYDFGFHGIANTRTLRRLYEEEHGGTAVHFTPQVDPTVFHGHPLRPAGGPRRLFFYGRPGHPRNGFELAAVALADLKARVGDRVRILCAGAPWDARDYGLEGVIENLGLLEYRATADLYRSCHIGFVMMMTRHPSYLPFEFMACGGLLVSNDNPANHWLLADGENCLLAPASAPAIAERLAEAVDRYDDLLPVRRRGWEQIRSHHTSWDRAFADVWAFIADRSGKPVRQAA
ncbi:MAG: glycosyltransferase [Pirellulales bacterium]